MTWENSKHAKLLEENTCPKRWGLFLNSWGSAVQVSWEAWLWKLSDAKCIVQSLRYICTTAAIILAILLLLPVLQDLFLSTRGRQRTWLECMYITVCKQAKISLPRRGTSLWGIIKKEWRESHPTYSLRVVRELLPLSDSFHWSMTPGKKGRVEKDRETYICLHYTHHYSGLLCGNNTLARRRKQSMPLGPSVLLDQLVRWSDSSAHLCNQGMGQGPSWDRSHPRLS